MTTPARTDADGPAHHRGAWSASRDRGAVVSWLSPVTVVLSALVLTVIAAIGGWMRRWMSDDGLIVLRTVRNLLAGNGPVFNAGERVEANTSTIWQYLIYAGAVFSDARLETIAMWLALGLTVLAVFVASLATGWMYALSTRRAGNGLIFAPLGGLVYLALPPARDFATSGLEWGLCLIWLAIQWALLVWWVARGSRIVARNARTGRHRIRPAAPGADLATIVLAFWSGLSWLVRPEFALYGGLTGILLLLSTRRFTTVLAIIAVAVPVPGAYQIFRMGYYGLLTPHTAVAKSASDARWSSGVDYVLDLHRPYALVLAVAVLIFVAGALVWRAAGSAGPGASHPAVGWQGRLRTRGAIVMLITGAAFIHFLYVLRVGGDFMHGRMLLLPLFTFVLPVFVVPVVEVGRRLRFSDVATSIVIALSFASIVVWAIVVMQRGTGHVEWERLEDGGIVDEREFWTYFTQRSPGDSPLYAEDFLAAPNLGDWTNRVAEARAMNAAVTMQYAVDEEATEFSWWPVDRMETATDLNDLPTTIYHVNLGMTSMNAPLDVRILDTVGLTNPLAARQPRDSGGRIGHDKSLERTWQMADTAADLALAPPWVNSEEAMVARAALRTPEIAELFASYREPMSVERFVDNLRFALGLGRTLTVPEDAAELLDATTRALITANAAAFQGSSLQMPGVVADPQIAWPIDVRTDEVMR